MTVIRMTLAWWALERLPSCVRLGEAIRYFGVAVDCCAGCADEDLNAWI